MDEEISQQGMRSTEHKEGLPSGLLLVVIIFALKTLYFLSNFFATLDRFFDTAIVYIFVTMVYLLPLFSISYRKKSGLYLGALILSMEIVLGLLLLNYGAIIWAGLVLSVISLYLLLKNVEAFRKSDRTDKRIAILFVMIIALYLSMVVYTNYLKPRPEQYTGMVTQEAIEKGDWRVCEKLRKGRDDCVRSVAIAMGYVELCEKVSEGTDRNDCYLDIGIKLKNTTICDRITDYRKGMCYGGIN